MGGSPSMPKAPTPPPASDPVDDERAAELARQRKLVQANRRGSQALRIEGGSPSSTGIYIP